MSQKRGVFEIKPCGGYLGLYQNGRVRELAPDTKEGKQILKARKKVLQK